MAPFELLTGEAGEILIPLFLLALIIWLCVKRIGSARLKVDEDQLLRELLDHVKKMEQRISSLETLLTDKQEPKP